MGRLWLIARREIVAYTGVASFWIALVLGPILMGATALVSASLAHRPPPPAVQVVAADADLAAAAGRALAAAGLRVAAGPARSQDGPRLDIAADTPTTARVQVDGALPGAALALLDRELRLAMQQRLLDAAGAPELSRRARAVEVVVQRPPPRPGSAVPAERLGRFGVTMLLWLTLVGALGMLLQALVRERAQRALECLMSSARPSEMVGGKLLGVGIVSLLVIGAWLVTGAAAAALVGGTGGRLSGLLLDAAFGDPLRLAFELLVYVLAFAMYGAALVGVGAFARDTASAQNLARPVFGVLLLVFFGALSELNGSGGFAAALIWAPPVTPFVLLLAPPGALSLGQVLAGLALMAGCTAVGLAAASRLLVAQLDGGGLLRRRPALPT